MVEAKRKQAISEILTTRKVTKMCQCCVSRCRNESVLYLRDRPLCEKHWGEYCDNKEVK